MWTIRERGIRGVNRNWVQEIVNTEAIRVNLMIMVLAKPREETPINSGPLGDGSILRTMSGFNVTWGGNKKMSATVEITITEIKKYLTMLTENNEPEMVEKDESMQFIN